MIFLLKINGIFISNYYSQILFENYDCTNSQPEFMTGQILPENL